MAGNGLKSMKDEKKELQKHIGCITGFFKLFDRHRFIIGQRASSSYIQQTPSSGVTNNGIKELGTTKQKTKAKNQKITREKQQFSTESSVTSVSSSSCSSSMSSCDFNRVIKTESSSTKLIQIPKNPHSNVSTKQHDSQSHQSLDFYDIIKDSMHKEAKGLYVKTLTKQGKMSQAYGLNQHIDSPRPMISQKSTNAGVMVYNEPLHTLSKSKKAHWDSPRLSYDALKSTTKHKELPRLSLDSKQGSIRGISEGNKARNLSNGPQKGYERNSGTMVYQMEEPETSKRSSSVVAKLMGLEVLPNSTQACTTSSCYTDKTEVMSRTGTSDEYKKHQSSASPRKCQGFNSSPYRRDDDSITNVTRSSGFALESTPWKQIDSSQSSQIQDSKGSGSLTKPSKSSLSVYGEIEKRLAELEFKKSGKDLRALKQILEAMQRFTESSDNKNNTSLSESSKVQTPRIQRKDSDTPSVAIEMSNLTRISKLPIVIMKPTKVTKKANNPPSTELSIHDKSYLRKCSPTNGRLVDKQKAKGIGSTTKITKETFGQPVSSNLTQSSKSLQESNRKNSINSSNTTVTGSPRLQKKFGFEKRSPPTSPSSDSTINRRQHNRQQNFYILQERDEHFSEMNCHWKKFKHHVNVISSDFDSNKSLNTQSGIQVIRIDQSETISNSSIQLNGLNKNNTFEELRKENYKAEKIVTAEQPSPVSVLDAAFYEEDPPSPVKKKSNISKKLGETLTTDDDTEENSVAHVLQEIDWIHEELINFNNINSPDHKYILEILLASGFISDQNFNQILHSQGHMINLKIFFALEQMKINKMHFNIEDDEKKIQRKLVFDVVNDILVKKLIYESSSSLCFLPNELACRNLKGKKLFEELCTEIDGLEPQNRNISFVHEDENLISLLCRDLKDHNTIWTNSCSEMPNMALDIERLIFKDLITEFVSDELANHFGGHCRQILFPK